MVSLRILNSNISDSLLKSINVKLSPIHFFSLILSISFKNAIKLIW